MYVVQQRYGGKNDFFPYMIYAWAIIGSPNTVKHLTSFSLALCSRSVRTIELRSIFLSSRGISLRSFCVQVQ